MDLGVIGNCAVAALVSREGAINWFCLPRFDGDPVFHSLMGHGAGEEGDGEFAVELEDMTESEQSYLPNTAILRTVLRSAKGAVEIVDFCPRFTAYGRSFRPQMLVRQVRRIEGSPRVRMRLKPRFQWGEVAPTLTRGSNHVRFVGPEQNMRLTTDAPIDHVLDGRMINLEGEMTFILGPDETLSDSPEQIGTTFRTKTTRYWQRWTQRLAIPFEWQEAVIRAAITLKLCSYEATGGVIPAITTSFLKRRIQGATGITAIAGSAMRFSPCARSTASPRPAPWSIISNG